MADDVMDKAASDATPAPTNAGGSTIVTNPESRADRARRFAYRSRFAAFDVLLAIVAGVGVGTLLVLVGRGSPAPRSRLVGGELTGTAEQRTAQIAEHGSNRYRLPSGHLTRRAI